jgi:hypothetical protein
MSKTIRWIRKAIRIDRPVEITGDNWPVLDFDLLRRGRKGSLLAAKLFARRKPRAWENFKE